ncbi:MAG: NAD-dependent epimerase/dehydratase family protein [Methanospirillaceae archaeon]|nr:NAD-dependent epimerase/dehydratase family protein [Methanospirillaceae archaeon]
MKALVTGCAGFIGSHLTDRLLSMGYEVVGIDCFRDYYPRPIKERNIQNALQSDRFQFIEEDLHEMSEYPTVDYVFHSAAQAGVRASWGDSFAIYTHDNIEVTQRLLEYYKENPVRRFVYASSSSVYGDALLPMQEDARVQPVSPYGVTKLAAEHLCYLYWKNYTVPTVSLRYFTVFGPRQRPDMGICRFFKAVLAEEEITVYGDGIQTRDFTYVDDIVQANICAMQATLNSVAGQVFNIGGGNRISVNELISLIGTITGKKPRTRYEDTQKGDVRDTCADVSKAGEFLEWKAETGIRDGLERYWDWYQQAGRQD